MDRLEKQALQVAKEIVVKFIETGRISPGNFGEHFSAIYNDVLRTVSASLPEDSEPDRSTGEAE